MRHKPWEAIGMSRATWYRHGKPEKKPYRMTQAQIAKLQGVSLRSLQRAARVLRVAPELESLISGGLSLHLAEQAAKMTPDERKRFLDLVLKASDEEAS
jgi:hypothetical protein